MRRLNLAVDVILQARQQRLEDAESRMDEWTREEFAYWYNECNELAALWQQQRDDCAEEMQRRFPEASP
jgi:hypothetical protein